MPMTRRVIIRARAVVSRGTGYVGWKEVAQVDSVGVPFDVEIIAITAQSSCYRHVWRIAVGPPFAIRLYRKVSSALVAARAYRIVRAKPESADAAGYVGREERHAAILSAKT